LEQPSSLTIPRGQRRGYCVTSVRKFMEHKKLFGLDLMIQKIAKVYGRRLILTARLWGLESRLILNTLVKLGVLTLVILVLGTAAWFSLLSILFLYLVSIGYSTLASMLVVGLVSFLCLSIFLILMYRAKKELACSKERMKLYNRSIF
jgi:hypothetical protein